MRHQSFVEPALAQALKSDSLARQGMAPPAIEPNTRVVVNGPLELRKPRVD